MTSNKWKKLIECIIVILGAISGFFFGSCARGMF